MRKTIAEMMAKGLSLEDIQIEVEKIAAAVEQEKKEKELECAALRAGCALADFLNAALGQYLKEGDHFSGDEFAEHLMRTAMAHRQAYDFMGRAQAEMTPIKEDEAEIKIREFLKRIMQD